MRADRSLAIAAAACIAGWLAGPSPAQDVGEGPRARFERLAGSRSGRVSAPADARGRIEAILARSEFDRLVRGPGGERPEPPPGPAPPGSVRVEDPSGPPGPDPGPVHPGPRPDPGPEPRPGPDGPGPEPRPEPDPSPDPDPEPPRPDPGPEPDPDVPPDRPDDPPDPDPGPEPGPEPPALPPDPWRSPSEPPAATALDPADPPDAPPAAPAPEPREPIVEAGVVARVLGWLVRGAVGLGLGVLVAAVLLRRGARGGLDLAAAGPGRGSGAGLERLGRRSDDGESPRTPEAWDVETDRALAQGRPGDAVRAVFQAVLGRLHRAGVLEVLPARSNGDIVARVEPASRRERLAALTDRFERIRYGGYPASADDVARCRELGREILEGTGGGGS